MREGQHPQADQRWGLTGVCGVEGNDVALLVSAEDEAPHGAEQGSELKVEAAPTKRRCPPSWVRLISKVYHADPLVCKGCGGPLKIVAYITDELSIRRILDHLGLSPLEQEKPPPRREVVLGAGRRRGAGDPGRLRAPDSRP